MQHINAVTAPEWEEEKFGLKQMAHMSLSCSWIWSKSNIDSDPVLVLRGPRLQGPCRRHHAQNEKSSLHSSSLNYFGLVCHSSSASVFMDPKITHQILWDGCSSKWLILSGVNKVCLESWETCWKGNSSKVVWTLPRLLWKVCENSENWIHPAQLSDN